MKRKQKLQVLIALLIVCSGVETWARSWRVAQVPNGQNFGCALCHLRSSGGGARNPFGNEVAQFVGFGSRADFWTAALAEIDSDGDGFSNGAEVGDPDGDGSATAGAQVTHPGDANSRPEVVVSLPDVDGVGLSRIVADTIVFDTDLDNLDNWEPYSAVIGNEVFVVEANTFAEPLDDMNQNYAVAFQAVGGGDVIEMAAFFGDNGLPYHGQINASRQNGNPGRIAADRRPGATTYVVGGEASPHVFDAFQGDDRWNLGFDRLEDGRYGTVQIFSLGEDLNPEPLTRALDGVNGRLTSGFPNGNQISRFGGDLAVLDNGNVVVVVDDRSGLREASNSTTAAILAPDGNVVKESWVVDPRDIWSNVTSYKGGFCVRVHDILYFYDNAGEPTGQVHQVDDLPETLAFDTGRGDATRIASHINSTLVFLAGTTTLFGEDGFELEDEDFQFRSGVQIAVFDAATQSFLSHRTVSEVSLEQGGTDDFDLFGTFGRVNLAVDALDRVAVAFELDTVDTDAAQTFVRVLEYDVEADEWSALTPSFYAYENHSDFEIRTIRPSVAMTTKEILVAGKGEINRGNDPEAGADTLNQTTFYTVFSHPDPQDDPTPGVVIDADPILVTATSASGTDLAIEWSGGVGPFGVERKTTLNDSAWTEIATSDDRTVIVPQDGPVGFLRIIDRGQ